MAKRTRKAIQIIIPLFGSSVEESDFDTEDGCCDREHERLTSHVMDKIEELGKLLSRGDHRSSLFAGSKSVGVVLVDEHDRVIPSKKKARS